MKPEPEELPEWVTAEGESSDELATVLKQYLSEHPASIRSLAFCQDTIAQKAQDLLDLIRSSPPPPPPEEDE